MPRPKNVAPTYKRHAPPNTARCWYGGKWVSLGRYGSPESRVEFARIVAEANAPIASSNPTRRPADLTVAELLAAFFVHARTHYRKPDGTPTTEFANFQKSAKPLRELFAHPGRRVRAARAEGRPATHDRRGHLPRADQQERHPDSPRLQVGRE